MAFNLFNHLHPRLIKDSRGKKSWTHTLAVPSIITLTLWFIAGGMDITFGTTHILIATRAASEYAIAVAIWFGFLGQREYVDKVKGVISGTSNTPGTTSV